MIMTLSARHAGRASACRDDSVMIIAGFAGGAGAAGFAGAVL
jgi:hypothetical protein